MYILTVGDFSPPIFNLVCLSFILIFRPLHCPAMMVTWERGEGGRSEEGKKMERDSKKGKVGRAEIKAWMS